MAQEEILLQDLCARLPYGVMLETPTGIGYLGTIELTIFGHKVGVNIKATEREDFLLEDCKVYLRSMSSMTDEEKEEFWIAIDKDIDNLENNLDAPILFKYKSRHYRGKPNHYELDFLISHHFDYRGLIEKGLAIEAPEGMYKIE